LKVRKGKGKEERHLHKVKRLPRDLAGQQLPDAHPKGIDICHLKVLYPCCY